MPKKYSVDVNYIYVYSFERFIIVVDVFPLILTFKKSNWLP